MTIITTTIAIFQLAAQVIAMKTFSLDTSPEDDSIKKEREMEEHMPGQQVATLLTYQRRALWAGSGDRSPFALLLRFKQKSNIWAVLLFSAHLLSSVVVLVFQINEHAQIQVWRNRHHNYKHKQADWNLNISNYKMLLLLA